MFGSVLTEIYFSIQAIQDITRTYDIPPEDIVTLIYEKIDVHGEGEKHQTGDSRQRKNLNQDYGPPMSI